MAPEHDNQGDLRDDAFGAQRGHPPYRDEVASDGTAPVRLRRSRWGEMWIGLIIGALVLVVLLIFVLQNGQRVDIAFLSAEGRLPLGVALLLAGLAGALVVTVPGSARIAQLRRSAEAARHGPTKRSADPGE